MASLVGKAVPVDGWKNISLVTEGKTLFILSDLSKDFGVSSTGKSTIIATTSGGKPLGRSGASLGINLFVKDLQKRNLTPAAIAGLRRDEFQECGESCQWRMEADGVTLCVRIDFATAKERDASSGKTVLLATSSGFKPVGKTGVSFSLNCYRPKDAVFDPAKITEAAEVAIAPGDAPVEVDGGYTIHYKSATVAVLSFRGNVEGFTQTVSLKDCRLDAVTTTLILMPPKAQRTKTEAGETKGAGAAAAAAAAGAVPREGGLLAAPSEGVLNVKVTCTGAQPNGGFTVTVTFDPSLKFGVSASGKSFIVATTAGFQSFGGSDGKVVGRLQFLAYSPAPRYPEEEVKAAVEKVLGRHSAEVLPTLTLRQVIPDVLEELGADKALKGVLKQTISDAVVGFLGRVLPSQSQ